MTIALKHVLVAATLWALICTGIVWHLSHRLPRPLGAFPVSVLPNATMAPPVTNPLPVPPTSPP